MTSTVNAMSNFSTTTAPPQGPIPESPDWYWVLSWLTAITTTTGNGLVIFLIITRRSLHLTNNYFILSLAVADILTGIFVIPVSFIIEKLKVPDVDVLFLFINTVYFASIANICTLTVDRYISIVIPLKYFLYMDNKKVIILISASWVLPLIIAGIPSMYANSKNVNQANRIYQPMQIFVLVVLPIALMLIVYARIYFIARKLARQTSQTSNQLRFNDANANGVTEGNVIYKKERRERRNREGSVAVLGAVIILFALCYLLPIYNTICQIFQLCPYNQDLVWMANVFLQLNSSMNAIVYAALKKDIRRELKKLFCGRNRDSIGGTSFGNNSSYSFAANTSTKIEMH